MTNPNSEAPQGGSERPRRANSETKTKPEPAIIKDIRRKAPDAPYEFLVDENWVQRKFLGSDPAASVATYKAANPDWKEKCGGGENPAVEVAAAPAASPAAVPSPTATASPTARKRQPAAASKTDRITGKGKGGKKQKNADKGGKGFSVEDIKQGIASLEYMVDEMSKPSPEQVTEQVKSLASGMSATEKLQFASSITTALFG